MPIFDFKCGSCGAITEDLVRSSVTTIPCVSCGKASTKQLAAPRVNWLAMGSQRDASPEAIIKFDRMHRQQKAKEEKSYAEHGDYGPHAGS
jgi:putative FmdB family regulatory protein